MRSTGTWSFYYTSIMVGYHRRQPFTGLHFPVFCGPTPCVRHTDGPILDLYIHALFPCAGSGQRDKCI